jgi:hypothetical protein
MAAVLLVTGTAVAQAKPFFGWQIKQVAGKATHHNEISSVSAVSKTDAWFAGFTCLASRCNADGFRRTSIFVEHWNGHAFRGVVIPRKWAYGNDVALLDIRATSASDAWVFTRSSAGRFWALHWNGRRWAKMVIPAFTTSPMVFGPNDIWTFSKAWAAGAIEEYRQHAWHKVRLSWQPETATALSAKDIWALARSKPGTAQLMRWNGRSWTKHRIAIPGSAQGMTADGARDVWVESLDAASNQGALSEWNNGSVTSDYVGAAPLQYVPGGPLTSDGVGGVWATSLSSCSPGGCSDGPYVEQFDFHTPPPPWQGFGAATVPYPNGGSARVKTLEQEPGTQFVWATGYERAPRASGTRAVIWRFTR